MTKIEIQKLQKAALAQIEIEVQEAYDSLKRARIIADNNGVSFSFSPAYGMGGWYNPTNGVSVLGVPEDVPPEEWESENDWEESGWQASSHNC